MNEILVFGHKNPDTDAICAPIAYAEFKRLTGTPHVVACRCGDTNDRIDFVLNTFRQPAPRFVPDITPKVTDIMKDKVEHASVHDTALDVISQMDEKNLRVLPVLDDDRRVKGLVSVFKLSHYYMPSNRRLQESRHVRATLANIAKSLNSRDSLLTRGDVEEELILMIAAMEIQTFTRRFENYPPDKVILVVGDRVDIQFAAVRSGVRLIVITGGLSIEPEIREMAEKKGVSVIVSPYDSATTSMILRASVRIESMLDNDFLSFGLDTELGDARRRAATTTQMVFPVVDAEGRIRGIFSKSDFLIPVEKQIILVDHNELSQAVQGAEHARILEIIDHHKLGPVATNQPILFLNIPIGSSCSIVAEQYQRAGLNPSPSMAGIMMSGIITDTLNLRSPTTTPRDAEILAWLSSIAGIGNTELAEKIFASGSILSVKTGAQAITVDCKEYEEGGHRFSVAQVEELGFTKFWEKKDELLRELDAYAREKGYLYAALLVSDIMTNSSYLLVRGDRKFLATIDYEKVEPFIFDLPGVVSRKKQLLPYLLRCMGQMNG